MTTGKQPRAELWSFGQPLLALVVTGLVAVFVVVPTGGSSTTGTPAAAAADRPADLPAPSVGRSLALPGQGTPRDLDPKAGPGNPAGDSRVVRLSVLGRERGYLLLPALGLARGQQAALVVVLHQDVGSAQAVAEGLGLDSLRRKGVTLVYPAGVGGSWNSGGCCGVAKDQGVDDVAFVNAVLDDVGTHTPIDPQRRGLVGYSGGGMLAYRVLCHAHPSLAAAVEVSGSLESHCPTGVVLPDLLSIHGAKDGTVGLRTPIHVNHLGMSPRPVESTLTVVTKQARCTGRSTRDDLGMRVVHWKGCRGGSTVELQIVTGAGHGWDSVGGAARAIPFLEQRLLPS
jgi:polyhydroxybutyrate depolymerase